MLFNADTMIMGSMNNMIERLYVISYSKRYISLLSSKPSTFCISTAISKTGITVCVILAVANRSNAPIDRSNRSNAQSVSQ